MSDEGRVLGIDFGQKRIGISISDSARIIATPYSTIYRVGDQKVEHAQIADVANENGVTLFVVGLPINLDGGVGNSGQSIINESKNLFTNTGIRCVLHDERFTTVSAHNYLDEQGVAHKSRRDKVDKIAACIILQSWLDVQNNI